MKDLPKQIEPLVVTTVFDDEDGVEKYKGVPVDELLKGTIEETVWLLWTGREASEAERQLVRKIIILTADHGPAVAGAYTTILGASAGVELPQAVSAGIQMIGPRFGGAAEAAARNFGYGVENNLTIDQFTNWMKSKGESIFPGFGHRVFSRSKPDKRVAELVSFTRRRLVKVKHLDFALKVEEELLKKNEKLILNIDGAIGAVLLDAGFPTEGIDGFFVLARTIGLIAHYIDQKHRGTGLIRLPDELVFSKNP